MFGQEKGMKSNEDGVAAIGSLKVNAEDVKRTQLKTGPGIEKGSVG